jgi:hypothetical protein
MNSKKKKYVAYLPELFLTCLFFKLVFSSDFKKNTGIVFWFEQIISLYCKRFRVFYRRFILASFILLGPIVMVFGLFSVISNNTNVVNSKSGTIKSLGPLNLDLTWYGTQKLPYYLGGAVSTTGMSTILSSAYTTGKKPGVTLESLSTDTVNDYVLALRKNSLDNLRSNYHGGMSLYLTASTTLTATFYYSTLAYNSAGIMLNEIDNLILQLIKGDTTCSISTYNEPIVSASTYSLSNSNFLDLLSCVDIIPFTLVNFFTSMIVAFMIAIMTMHVSKERINGSKQLQYLSGTHYMTYWFSNFLYDWPIFFFNISCIMLCMMIMGYALNDVGNEVYGIGTNSSLMGQLFFLIVLSSFSWCMWAYVWSFLFKSDIVGFIVLLIMLVFLAFMEGIMSFVQLLLNGGSGSRFVSILRGILALIFPNITIKRGIYDLKIQSNSFCVSVVNQYLGGKKKMVLVC